MYLMKRPEDMQILQHVQLYMDIGLYEWSEYENYGFEGKSMCVYF